MARISTYGIDGTPVSSDKLIGTDSSGTTTKNYPLGSVSDWLKESGASAVLGQNNYSFQIALDPDAGRLPGSFSFENYGGDGTEFINVSRLTISKSSSTGKYVGDYLLSTVGDRVMLGQLDDLNSFGVYTLVSLVQNSIEPTFYDAELLFVEGNGALQGNKSYGLATYSASASAGSAVWGSIEGTVTNQTDLVDYIDAEIAAIPTPATPTLQSVTDEGNTTTNNIGIGTSSPSYPLHVVGNSLVTGTQFIGDTFTRIQQGSGNLILSNLSSNGSVVLRTNSVEQMRLTSAGRVGIGTTNPISKLELQDGTFTVDNGNIDVFFGGISIDRNSANNTALKVNQRGTADIFALQDDGTDVLTIIDGGNVGIGTTEPGSTLPSDAESGSKILQLTGVSGSSGDTAILLRSSDNSSGFDLWHNASSGDSYIDNRYFYGDTIFRVRTASTPNEVVRITPDGNVGIGTTAPAAKLDVDGSIYPTRPNGGTLGLLQFKEWSYVATPRITGNNNRMELLLSGETVVLKDHNTIGDGIQIKNRNNVVAQFGDANGSGNVGIGTTAPTYKLYVSGVGTFGTGTHSQVAIGNYLDSFSGRSSAISTNNHGDFALASNLRINTDRNYTTINTHSLMSGAAITLAGNGNAYGEGSIYFIAQAPVSTTAGTQVSASAAKMILKSDTGNVGIGTTTPAAKLDVSGSNSTIAVFRTTNASADLYLRASGTTSDGKVGIRASGNNLRFISYGATQAAFNVGNLGLGTSAAAYKLDVVGDIRALKTSGTASVIAEKDANFVALNADATSGYINYGHTSNNRVLRIVGNGSEVARFDTSGNLGIGTTAPTEKLYVAGSIGINSAQSIKWGAGGTKITGIDGSFISIYPNNNTERVRFLANGNVGIGTTSPVEKVHINGNLRLGLAGSTGHYISWGQNEVGSTGDFARIQGIRTDAAGNQAGHLTFQTKQSLSGTAPAERLRITDIGNVGIGTTAPTEKLEVVGKMVLKDAGGSVYIGELAGTNDNAVGRYNVGIGDYALNSNTSGYNNVAIGSSAMYNSTSGFRNVALGVFALGDNVSGHGNTAIGYSANTLSTEGYMNVAVGYEALENATTAYWNTAVGAGALQNSDAPASDNTAVGFYAMNLLTTGRYNTSLGTYALSDTELGSDNTAVGYYAGGGDYQGTQSVYLGMNTSPNSWNETNQIVIGYGASGNGSNSVTLGNASITKTILKGNVGIGTTAPSTLLHLRGDSPTLRIEADGANESSIIELVQDGGVTGAAIKYNGASNIEALQFNTGVSDTRMTIKRATGNVGIGTTAPSSKVHINGTAMEQLRMETQGGPVNAADAKGSIGDMAYDADFFYIKTSNGWGRVPLDFGF